MLRCTSRSALRCTSRVSSRRTVRSTSRRTCGSSPPPSVRKAKLRTSAPPNGATCTTSTCWPLPGLPFLPLPVAVSTRWPFTTKSVRRPFLSFVITTVPGLPGNDIGPFARPLTMTRRSRRPGRPSRGSFSLRSPSLRRSSITSSRSSSTGGTGATAASGASGAVGASGAAGTTGATGATRAARLLVSATAAALAGGVGPVCQSNTSNLAEWLVAANGPARATLLPSRPSPPSISTPASRPSPSVGAAGRRCTRRRTRSSRAPGRFMAARARRGAAGTTALWLHSARAVRARASRSGSPPTRAVAVSSQQFSRSVRTQLAINHTAGW